MDTLLSRVSFLSGMIEGMAIDKTKNEGKIITEITSILKDMADEIEFLKEAQNEMEDYVDTIDEDLSDLEEEFYYDEDEDDCYDEDDCENYIDIECPHCGETVYIDTDICNCNEEISCPNCHKEIPLDESNEE
ncbi:CD1247 N-terminal domain-containing protein [Candidatus Clostridium stratigraminis]|uniref:CD1247 N-terminal domain-containing protein n=1 Tax=Candidatus Clostridium stratigraminis TaxID=3381661 RepID=A0ABW8T450_9CLOT